MKQIIKVYAIRASGLEVGVQSEINADESVTTAYDVVTSLTQGLRARLDAAGESPPIQMSITTVLSGGETWSYGVDGPQKKWEDGVEVSAVTTDGLYIESAECISSSRDDLPDSQYLQVQAKVAALTAKIASMGLEVDPISIRVASK